MSERVQGLNSNRADRHPFSPPAGCYIVLRDLELFREQRHPEFAGAVIIIKEMYVQAGAGWIPNVSQKKLGYFMIPVHAASPIGTKRLPMMMCTFL